MLNEMLGELQIRGVRHPALEEPRSPTLLCAFLSGGGGGGCCGLAV